MSDLYRIAPRSTLPLTVSNPVRSPPATPQFTPRTPPATGPRYTIAAVGDGVDGSPASHAVANLVRSWNPNVFAYLGDVYDRGSAFEFDNWYADPEGFGPGLQRHHQPHGRQPRVHAPAQRCGALLRLLGERPALLQLRRRRLARARARLDDGVREDERPEPAEARVAAVRVAGRRPCRAPRNLHARVHAPPAVQRGGWRCAAGARRRVVTAVRPWRHHGARRARAHLRALDPVGRHRFSGGGRAHAVHRRHRRPRDPESRS